MVFALDVIGWLAGTSPTPASTGIPSGIPKWIEESPFWSQYLSQIVGWVTIAILGAVAAAIWRWRISIGARIHRLWKERLVLIRRPLLEASLAQQYSIGLETGREESRPTAEDRSQARKVQLAELRAAEAEDSAHAIARRLQASENQVRELTTELYTARRQAETSNSQNEEAKRRFGNALRHEYQATVEDLSKRLSNAEREREAARTSRDQDQKDASDRAFKKGYEQGAAKNATARKTLEEEIKRLRATILADSESDGSSRLYHRPTDSVRSGPVNDAGAEVGPADREVTWSIQLRPSMYATPDPPYLVFSLENTSTLDAYNVGVDGGPELLVILPQSQPIISGQESVMLAVKPLNSKPMKGTSFRVHWSTKDKANHSATVLVSYWD